jgi:hypothetical protein
MVINDDMLDDLASQFKKYLEEEGSVQKKWDWEVFGWWLWGFEWF